MARISLRDDVGYFDVPVLYRDELDRIYERFQAVAAAQAELASLSVESGRYASSTLDDLLEADGRPVLKELQIKYKTLEFSVVPGYMAALRIGGVDRTDIRMVQAYGEIEEILKSRSRDPLREILASFAFSAIGGLLAGTAGYVIETLSTGTVAGGDVVSFAGAGFFTFFFIRAMYFRIRRLGPSIHVESKRDSATFVARNRDALLVGSIVALVSAALGVAVTLATSR
jgi:hypothetical protein